MTYADVFSPERQAAVAGAIRKYWESVPLRQRPEHAKQDGFKPTTISSWIRGSSRKRVPVMPSPSFLWKLYQVTQNGVFLLTAEEVKKIDAIGDRRYLIPEDLRGEKKQSETSDTSTEPVKQVKHGSHPAYSMARLGEIADAAEAYYQHVLKTTQSTERDDFFRTFQKAIWLRQRPEKRNMPEKMTVGPGPDKMLELYRRTRNPAFILRSDEVSVFQDRGDPRLVVSEEMLQLSASLESGSFLRMVEPTAREEKTSPAQATEEKISLDSSNSQRLVNMDAKLQSMLGFLEVFLSKLPETRELLGAEISADKKSLTILIPRQMNVLRATLLTLDGLLAQVPTVELSLKNTAIDLVWQMIKVFRLGEEDFLGREPKEENDSVFMARLNAIFGKRR